MIKEIHFNFRKLYLSLKAGKIKKLNPLTTKVTKIFHNDHKEAQVSRNILVDYFSKKA